MVKHSGSYRDKVTSPGLTYGAPRQPRKYGLFLYDDFDRTPLGSDYVILGASTWTPNSPMLAISGGLGTFTHRMRYGGPNNFGGHAFEDFTIEWRFQLNSTPSGATTGIGIGISDFAFPDGQRDIIGQLFMSTSAGNGGKAIFQTFDGTTNVIVASSAVQLVRNLGEFYTVRFRKSLKNNLNTFELEGIRELDGSSSGVATWTEPLSYPQTSFAFSSGQFAVWSIQGNIFLDYWKIEVNDLVGIQDLFVGDSITHGAYATNMATRWAANVSDNYSISAGSGDGVDRVLDRIQNIINYDPARVFLMIGGNDILNGTATATWQANYLAVVNRLKAERIKVVHLLPTPRTPTNVTALVNFINREPSFITDQIIDTFNPLRGSGTGLSATYDAGDGIHPNQAGHNLIARVIRAQI